MELYKTNNPIVVIESLGKDGNALHIFCPGCWEPHRIFVGDDLRTDWQWDHNYDYPTISPSINLGTQYGRCHSFIREGIWDFLGDCTHYLRGQKVGVIPFPDSALEKLIPPPPQENPKQANITT